MANNSNSEPNASRVFYNDDLASPELDVMNVQDAIDKLKGSSPSGGALSTIIFRPGGVAGGNVFTDAAGVATALDAANGAAFVYVDGSLDDCVLPAGVVWDFQGFGGLVSDSLAFTELEIEDTAQLKNPGIISGGVLLICDSQTLPSIDFSDWSAGPTLAVNYCGISLGASATTSPIQVPANASFFLNLTEESTFNNGNAPSVAMISLAAGAELFTIFTTFTQAVVDVIPTNLVSGDDTTTWSYAGDGSAFPTPDFEESGFLGTFTYQLTTPITILFDGSPLPNEPAWSPFDNGNAGLGLGSVAVDVTDDPGTGTLSGSTLVGLGVYMTPVPIVSDQGGSVLGSLQGEQQVTLFNIDTSGGPPTGPYLLPSTGISIVADGAIYIFKDSAAGGAWQTNTPSFETSDGTSLIEDPLNPGTYSTAVVAPASPSACFAISWSAETLTWSVLYSTAPIFGATGSRPTNPGIGLPFFDTTLGFPVWWSGAAWVNAVGAPS